MKVDFFIVGSQRCGTTYLYQVLDQHPEIFLAKPVKPEPKFFIDDKQHAEGYSWYINRYFSEASEIQLLGEKSTSYIEYEAAAERIYSYNKDAKIIVLVRDPVERALSNYRFSVDNGIENLDFYQAILSEKERLSETSHSDISVSPYAYFNRGLYINYLDVYLKYFPKNNIKVVVTENLLKDTKEVQAVLDFLEVKRLELPSPGQVNESQKRDVALPTQALDYLKACYRESNQELEEKFNLDLSLWSCQVK
jgi:hypothetical protein